MPALPEAILANIAEEARTGDWVRIYELLSAGGSGPDVCLLSAIEIRATPTTLSIAARSRRLAANLQISPFATLVAWADHLHYISLELTAQVRDESGVGGYAFAIRDVRVDDIGVQTRPLEYQMHPRLAADERWEATRSVLLRLQGLGDDR